MEVSDFCFMSLENWTKSLDKFCGLPKNSVDAFLDETKNNVLKGQKFFKEGYVQKVIFHPAPFSEEKSQFSCVKARCIPSMKSGNYEVKVAINTETQTVGSALCSCPAGLASKCHHVAALLYYLVAVTDLGLKTLPESKACTEVLCQWIKPGGGTVRGEPLSDLGFSKAVTGNCKRKRCDIISNHYDPRAKSDREIDEEALKELYDNLQNLNSKCAFVTHFPTKLSRQDERCAFPDSTEDRSGHSEDTVPDTISSASVTDISSSEFQDTVEKYIFEQYQHLTTEEALAIEQKTIGQADNITWQLERQKRLTASNFGRISKLSVSPENLLKSLLYTKNFQNFATLHGKKNEETAINAYCTYKASMGSPVTVRKAGLFVMEWFSFLGASPDGIIEDIFTQDEGILEVKCPSSKFGLSILSATEDKTFFLKKSDDGMISLKRNHNYYYQIQACMAISGRSWCDFFVWNGHLEIQQHCERLSFDQVFWDEKVLPSVSHFFKYAYVPELILRNVQQGKPLYGVGKYMSFKECEKKSLV